MTLSGFGEPDVAYGACGPTTEDNHKAEVHTGGQHEGRRISARYGFG